METEKPAVLEQYTEQQLNDIQDAYYRVMAFADTLLEQYIETLSHNQNQYRHLQFEKQYLDAAAMDSESIIFNGSSWCRGDLSEYELEMPLAFVYSPEFRLQAAIDNKEIIDNERIAADKRGQEIEDANRAKRRLAYEKLHKEFGNT